MKDASIRPPRRKRIKNIVGSQILPAVSDAGFKVESAHVLVKVTDELATQIIIEPAANECVVYLNGLVYPLYAPHDVAALPGTLGGRSNYLFPGTAAAFDMYTEDDVRASVEQIVTILRERLIPFLSQMSSSRRLLDLHDSDGAPPVFSGHPYASSYLFLMGYVAAYCGEYPRVSEFFGQCRSLIENHNAYWVAPRLAEMSSLEGLLGDPAAVRRYLGTNAYHLRQLSKLPFPFDASVYGLPPDWHPMDAKSE